MKGFTKVEVVTLVGIMVVLAALVIVLMPQPVVQVEIKEVKVAAPEDGPGEVTISPDSLTFAPKSLTIEAESVTVNTPREEKVAPTPVVPTPQRRPATRAGFEAMKRECMNNVRNIVGLLEFAPRYPQFSGPNFILYLVKKGEIRGADRLGLLFCPGDVNESLAKAGDAGAYYDLDLNKRGEYGHMTSYAGRDQLNKLYAAKKGSSRTYVLVCDDSEDHHDGRGFVVGLNGGAAKWRDKARAWNLDPNTRVKVGEGSVVEELQCLRSE